MPVISVRIGSCYEQMKELWLRENGKKGKSKWVEGAITDYISQFDIKDSDFNEPQNDSVLHFLQSICDMGKLYKSDEEKLNNPTKVTLSSNTIDEISRLSSGVNYFCAISNEGFFRFSISVSDIRSYIIRSAIQQKVTESFIVEP